MQLQSRNLLKKRGFLKHIKKHLSFSSLRNHLARHLENIPEFRQKTKVKHSLHDVFMSGLAMMFFQDTSLLQFQKLLDDEIHNNNLKTLFQVQTIPKDSQMKDVIDAVESSYLDQYSQTGSMPCKEGNTWRIIDFKRSLSGLI